MFENWSSFEFILPDDGVVLFPKRLVPVEVPPPNKPPDAGVVEPNAGVPNVPAAGVLPKSPKN